MEPIVVDLTRTISCREALEYAEAEDTAGFFALMQGMADVYDMGDLMEEYITERYSDIAAWLARRAA